MKSNGKKDFCASVFEDDKRKVKSGSTNKSLAEAFEEINPPVSEDELELCIENPEKLPTNRLHFILARLQDDERIREKLIEIVKNRVRRDRNQK